MDPLADHRHKDIGDNKWHNYIKEIDFETNKLLGRDQPKEKKEPEFSPTKEGPIIFYPDMKKQQDKMRWKGLGTE
jgi:hypothetical protein